MDTSKELDIIIIGAGVHGIQAARTYLEIHRDHDVAILEAGAYAGGAWASDRAYGSLMTQTPKDFVEFSDKPIAGVPKQDLYHTHFPGSHFVKYLEDYLDSHVYNGKSIRSRLKTNSPVVHVEKEGNLWHVQTGQGVTYKARKLIDAVGLTSHPNIPDIKGRTLFEGLALHHKDFGRLRPDIDPSVKVIAVLGGAKSAADVAYAAAKAGKTVHWIIRKSGSGPCWFFPAYSLTGMLPCSTHDLWRRCMNPLFVSLFKEHGIVSRFLYRTSLGQAIFWGLWASVHLLLSTLSGFGRKDGQKNGFHHLKPDAGPFWANDSTGVANAPDFFDTIARHVQVYREDIASILPHGLKLANGTEIAADSIVFATGWRADFSHFEESLALRLGLPVPNSKANREALSQWETLERKAEVDILREMPLLDRVLPHHQMKDSNLTPLRLYNSVVPLTDSSVAFVGKTMIAHCFGPAEVQALYAVAALDKRISLPSKEDMQWQIARTLAWSRKRYPTRGQLGMWYPYDLVPYIDVLLKQLGLSSHRGSGWFDDAMTPTSTWRLSGLIEEYKQKYA